MFRNHFEHFGKHDGLQDEYLGGGYGLQMLSNPLSTGGRIDFDDFGPRRQESYAPGRSYYQRDIDESSFSNYENQFESMWREPEARSNYRVRKRVSPGHGSKAQIRQPKRREQENYYGINERLGGGQEELSNIFSEGMEDMMEAFQVRRDYGRGRRYRDYDRDDRYRRRYDDDDYELEREYRRRRRGRRLACDPFMLPRRNDYYPMGFCGPRIQFCPYVPIMTC